MNEQGHTTKAWTTRKGRERKGRPWNKPHLYRLIHNHTYLGEVSHKGKVYPGENKPIIERDLWDKVHMILKGNCRTRAGRIRAETLALLKGLIRCGHCGTSMGMTFTRRRGRAYRYYLCLHASKNGYGACPVKNVAVGEIERVVIDQLRRVFRDPEFLARTCRAAEGELTDTEVREALGNVDGLWHELFPGEQARIAELLVESVVIEEQGLVLNLRRNGLHSLALESHGGEAHGSKVAGDADELMSLAIPMRFKRRGGRKEILVPSEAAPASEIAAPPQEPLALALGRAFEWQELLDTGKVKSAGAIAKRTKVSKAYVTRLLRLTRLAPDIVQAILDGREPSGLSLVKPSEPMPMAWEEQRFRLGFSPIAASRHAPRWNSCATVISV